jgi:hypothetical protein
MIIYLVVEFSRMYLDAVFLISSMLHVHISQRLQKVTLHYELPTERARLLLAKHGFCSDSTTLNKLVVSLWFQCAFLEYRSANACFTVMTCIDDND